jgi:vacuolar-type H+-ATPase subunit H
MLATKEGIITTLADAKAKFESIINEERKSKKNIIANAGMYSGSIIDYLEAKADQINNTIHRINELKEEIAGQEAVELEESTKPEELPLTAKIIELRNELNKIAEDILEHLKA